MRYRQRVFNLIKQLCFMFVLPLIVIQARHIKKTAVRLPNAKGETRYQHPKNNISLLHIGESTVAGVGVKDLEKGLTHAIIKHLEQQANLSVNWLIQGENGATLSQLNKLNIELDNPDILLISVGVNDTTSLTSASSWRKQVCRCVERFAGKNTQVFFTQVPKISDFPALPAPLSWFLGARSQQLDHVLKALCQRYHWQYIDASLPINAQWMAEDGYHPNQHGYQVWGEQISHALLPAIKAETTSP